MKMAIVLAMLTVSCSGGEATGAPADGTEQGNCYPNGTCNAGLTCASNLCVKLGNAGGASGSAGSLTGGAAGSPASGGAGNSANGGGAGITPSSGGVVVSSGGASNNGGVIGGGGAPMIYCAVDAETCTCGHNADYGPSVPCSTTTVGSGVCCASPGWPATGLCYCGRAQCENYSATLCTCSAGAADPAKVATSCSAAVCCRSSSGTFERCDCWTDRTDNCALSGETPASSCGVADIKCAADAVAVAACN